MPETAPEEIEKFIERWSPSGGRERANYALFLTELCDLLALPRPEPAQADASENAYTFDRAITHRKADGTTAPRFIDLYRADCFVLETKQGVEAAQNSDSTGLGHTPNPVGHRPGKSNVAGGHGKRGTAGYDKAMVKAHAQAEGYIHDLPAGEGRPPFLIVCDIGYVFEFYAEFTQSGGRYQRFPDPKNHRIRLGDLRDPEVRELFRAVWTDPLSLDPSKRIARVTRDIADRLAKLAKSLEQDQHDPQIVAEFLQRCLFTMFAEDIGLLPEDGFLDLLKKVDDNPASFPALVSGLWKEMATGTDYSPLLLQKIAHFNGGLFETTTALPLSREQVDLLLDAARADWKEVDPAIFGTLLERALDPRERHKLGAHYTPRSYVERLIEPTVIEPLREKWEAAKAAAILLFDDDKVKKARKEVEDFHHQLCDIRILDPACGSGNFLYVTLEHLKQLEVEVLDFLEEIGGDRTLEMSEVKVRPKQFLGIEINPSAAKIAQLVIWIGYFQWHYKTTGKADTNDRPLLTDMKKIENRDAVLDYDEKIPRRDEEGNVVQIWDGVTTKPHPVTGKEVPDESAKKVLYDYTNPRRPDWPEADYVVGNPPFVGKGRLREFLGDGYVEALRIAWKGDVPESADFVMYWWEKSAEMLRSKEIERFGLITTNSIHQTFNRRILEKHLGDEKKPMHLAFAIADHPWVDSLDGAGVRISMTVGSPDDASGRLGKILTEIPTGELSREIEILFAEGLIAPNLKLGADINSSQALQANSMLAGTGLTLGGRGFILDESERRNFPSADEAGIIFPIYTGRDIADRWRSRFVIDTNGLTEDELQSKFPKVWQHLHDTVFPERQTNRDKKLRDQWWLFRRASTEIRSALSGLNAFIATPETSKHRIFVAIDGKSKPEHGAVAFGFEDNFYLGMLSSRLHATWALATGGTLEDRPRYNKTRCFETFPFPNPDDATRQRIRELGERLDAHRKRQQELHPDLTLTGIYNVLEKLRSGEALTPKEKKIHDDGLVSVLQQIHDDLDAAVFHAYGWDDLWELKQALDRGQGGASRVEHQSSSSDDEMEGQSPHCPTTGPSTTDEWENELLERLVVLNHERAAEEANGKVRWLRPEFQNPDGDDASATQSELAIPAAKKKAKSKIAKQKWPDRLTDQVAAIQSLLPTTGPEPDALSAAFGRKSAKREEQIAQVLEVLASLGRV